MALNIFRSSYIVEIRTSIAALSVELRMSEAKVAEVVTQKHAFEVLTSKTIKRRDNQLNTMKERFGNLSDDLIKVQEYT